MVECEQAARRGLLRFDAFCVFEQLQKLFVHCMSVSFLVKISSIVGHLANRIGVTILHCD